LKGSLIIETLAIIYTEHHGVSFALFNGLRIKPPLGLRRSPKAFFSTARTQVVDRRLDVAATLTTVLISLQIRNLPLEDADGHSDKAGRLQGRCIWRSESWHSSLFHSADSLNREDQVQDRGAYSNKEASKSAPRCDAWREYSDQKDRPERCAEDGKYQLHMLHDGAEVERDGGIRTA